MSYIKYLMLALVVLLGACTAPEDEPPMMDNPSMMDDPDMMDDPPSSQFEAAPDFSIQTTTGETLSLDQFSEKVLVIFFFGADCPPCRRIGPEVESRVHQEYLGNEQFAIIGADQWNRNDATVDDFVETTGISFPVGKLGAEMAKDFGTTFDRMVVLNQASEIVYRSPSRVSGKLDEAIGIIEDLLK